VFVVVFVTTLVGDVRGRIVEATAAGERAVRCDEEFECKADV
jgi:hypothetical protein